MHWCFATVNGRLAEIYFNKMSKDKCVFTHGYVNREWVVGYATKKEQKMIATDTRKFRLSYRNGRYKDLISGKIVRICPKPKWLVK